MLIILILEYFQLVRYLGVLNFQNLFDYQVVALFARKKPKIKLNLSPLNTMDSPC